MQRDKKYLKLRRVDKRATPMEKGGDGEKSENTANQHRLQEA